MKDKKNTNSKPEEEKNIVNTNEETDEFVKYGMRPLTDEQLDQAVGGID